MAKSPPFRRPRLRGDRLWMHTGWSYWRGSSTFTNTANAGELRVQSSRWRDYGSRDGGWRSPVDTWYRQREDTYSRVLGKYVREKHVDSLMDALSKMSLQPAKLRHLPGKGRLQVGADADITVFNLARHPERSEFAHEVESGRATVSIQSISARLRARHPGDSWQRSRPTGRSSTTRR